jgi:hypothetical protein
MRDLINSLLILLIAFCLCSCASGGKLLSKNQTPYGSIKFYAVPSSTDKSAISKVYADVDSNGTKMYYSFYPDRIVKTEQKAKQLSYTVSYDKLPDNYNSNIYCQFSPLDTLVLSRADALFQTLNYSSLKKSKGAEAFTIEVNYYHGWPKNKKFQPL